jgi:hypothetical protein
MMINEEAPLAKRHYFHALSGTIILLCVIFLAVILWFDLLYYPGPRGPQQPIPFSHRVHAGKKRIGCLVCHPEAALTSTGGIPPIERCMHCHRRIIPTFYPIQELRRHYEEKIPVVWNHVTRLPDFAYFPHTMHVNRSIDCSRCHGDVKAMDRVVRMTAINMGFCLSCHREYNAPVDCFTCHR